MSFEEVKNTVKKIYEQVKSENLEERDNLINILHAIQEHYGNYIPLEAAEVLKELTGRPLSEIYEVLTFYTMFSTDKRGKYIIRVCKSLPCHVTGGAAVLKSLKDVLGIDYGQTTEDGLFTLEESSCLGLCGVSPVMLINDEAYGNLTPEKVRKIIEEIKEKERSGVK
ncbi:MAG: NADH-quinone oxidoreductase subunit E [Thermotogae bacterium]|uniref:NADH-quinone oxidoreductase subunit NuoE family protein n=1 Tax=Kosmotoga sp. TaxID=1955248 RepID=UPI000F2D9136|nr:NAD(P)H-dependent oxidoreductase subunit E [Kosmotoga sp.]MCD6160434.1 NAD(P)H-dependent oxidoreductase subunit E [Kosmotoga sp.]RKX50709.1 MAG: NADH-quinone oxidoreductase subunit E [Thermotogota bacterium]